jgi:hypothetical protein
MSRDNARQDIFLVDPDRELFLDTLADTVHRFDWICHAYAANDQANAVRPQQRAALPITVVFSSRRRSRTCRAACAI